jgi:DNA repair and recombination protein RAD52
MADSVGDQHKENAATANPFEEARGEEKKQHISEYTAQEIATLQSRLDKQLGPEFISSRPGAAGQKVHYLPAEKVINLANEIFGFNGWSSSIQNIQIDFVDEHPETRKITLGLSVVVRVTLKDGTYHEDIGYGHIENCKGKAAAFEKAKKEGTTDALKRALRTFGNVLGNCVYDKEYVAKVTKIKVGVGKWDEKNLHRHPNFAPKQAPEAKPANQTTSGHETPSGETTDSFIDIGEFDDAEFDDGDFGHPDEVVLPLDPEDPAKRHGSDPRQHQNPSMPQHMTTPSRPPYGAPSGMHAPTTGQNVPSQSMPPQRTANTGLPTSRVEHPQAAGLGQQSSNGKQSSSPGLPSQHFAAPAGGLLLHTAGFYSARAAGNIDPTNNLAAPVLTAAVQFNPHAESPSIRKTSGVDHHRSGKLLRDGLQPESNHPPRREYIDPQADATRRVGAPPFAQGGQNMMPRPVNTSAYRPPTRRGPDRNNASNGTMTDPPGEADRVSTNTKRTPLSDVSNVQYQQLHGVKARTDDGLEAKRQRTTGPGLDGNASPPHADNENKPVGGVG